MALVFAWRADDADIKAKFSYGGPQGLLLPSGSLSRVVDAGAIGGYSIDASSGGAQSIVFNGGNHPNGRVFSYLMRRKADYTGSPSIVRGLFANSSGYGTLSMSVLLNIVHHTSGNIRAQIRNEGGSLIVNSADFGTFSSTAGDWEDHLLTWDGTSSADSLKYYINAVLIGSITPTGAMSAALTSHYWKALQIGGTLSNTSADASFEEFASWDEVIDGTANVALESGMGLLNGPSRTSFVSNVSGQVLTAFDGTLWTALAADKIKTGESQTQAGVTVNGTYDGSDRHTDPGEGNVRDGIEYQSNSTTNNKEGNVTLPTEAQVENEVGFGSNGTEFEGTFTGQIVYQEGDFKQTIVHEEETILKGIVVENTALVESDGVVIEDTDTDCVTVVIITGGEDD
jgi:hypothetical protein